MGREVRRVPANWQHPTDNKGRHHPLFDGSYAEHAREWDGEAAHWERGMVRDYDTGGWKPKPPSAIGLRSFVEWHGERPVPEDYMPDWPESERTHWQMYETCTEGTPISPAMESPEALARWLADNGASAFGSSTASYDAWLATIRSAHGSIGFATVPGDGMVTGPELELRIALKARP